MIADVLTALADPTRRRIFELIAESPKPVGEVAGTLPVSRPAVSQHLKVLREAGLVRQQIVGTRHVYSIDQSGLEQVRAYFDSFWDQSLTAFKAAAERVAAAEQSAATESATKEDR